MVTPGLEAIGSAAIAWAAQAGQASSAMRRPVHSSHKVAIDA